jgi:ribosome-binding protein aMBF1 (putative translation factor)
MVNKSKVKKSMTEVLAKPYEDIVSVMDRFKRGAVIKSDHEYKVLEALNSVDLVDLSIQINGTSSAKLTDHGLRYLNVAK